jgi:hypothetical protein
MTSTSNGIVMLAMSLLVACNGAQPPSKLTCAIKCKGPGLCDETGCFPGDALETNCKQTGGCNAVAVGDPPQCRCVPLTDEECLQSNACARFGSCGVLNSNCLPVSRLGCDKDQCLKHGLCTADGALCSSTEASCAASQDCLNRGECHSCAAVGNCLAMNSVPKTSYAYCEATSDEDCKKSKDCTDNGRCFFRPPSSCVPKNQLP